MQMTKVLIAMSGGVDSSVAALRLKQQGYELVGAMMKLHNYNPNIDEDIEDAAKVAASLDIPFHLLDFESEFNQEVILPFVEAYEAGLTPNPCITCNQVMKFGQLLKAAEALGCDMVATGHYARVGRDSQTGRYYLKKALNADKDQSYVLWHLTQEQLARILLPLGELSKSEVRELALEDGFVNADKGDSQDICFIPDGDYVGFLEQYRGKQYPEGDFVTADGTVLGRHQGIVRYTVGQRKGLGIAYSEKLFVSKKDAADNTVTLVPKAGLVTRSLIGTAANWLSLPIQYDEITVGVRTRYQQKELPGKVKALDEKCLEVTFDEPQGAVAPGQSVVLYQEDTVVGGAIIHSSS